MVCACIARAHGCGVCCVCVCEYMLCLCAVCACMCAVCGVCVCVCVVWCVCGWGNESSRKSFHLLSISNAENARAWTLYTHLQLLILISLVPVGPGNEAIILIFLPGVSLLYSIPVSLENLDIATAFAGLQYQ